MRGSIRLIFGIRFDRALGALPAAAGARRLRRAALRARMRIGAARKESLCAAAVRVRGTQLAPWRAGLGRA